MTLIRGGTAAGEAPSDDAGSRDVAPHPQEIGWSPEPPEGAGPAP